MSSGIEWKSAFFMKQLGGEFHKRGKEKAVLDGRRYTEYPTPKVEVVL